MCLLPLQVGNIELKVGLWKLLIKDHIIVNLNLIFTLHFSGATDAFRNYKRQIYIGLFVLVLLFSIFLAIPATVYSHIVLIQKDTGKK